MRYMLLGLIIVFFIISCTYSNNQTYVDTNTQDIKNSQNSDIVLSEVEKEACEVAHQAKTCTTKLVELGIIASSDCCKAIGKCC